MPAIPNNAMRSLSEGSVPSPDPTLLTTSQLLREVSLLRELLETRIGASERLQEILRVAMNGFPADTERLLESLKKLHEEKFRSIATQFAERDTRTEQTSRDSKVAVDAALQAAKEAVEKQNQSSALAIAKSEVATVKQIDQIGILLQANAKSAEDKISDLKDRLTLIEGRTRGMADGWGYLVGAAGIVATVMAIATVFVVKH